MAAATEVTGWVDARYGALLRSAYLLCGDPAEAAARTDGALARLLATAAPATEDREAVARSFLYADALRPPVSPPPDRPWVTAPRPVRPEEEADRTALWDHLAGLRPAERAMLVLVHHEGLTARQAATALGVPRAGGVAALDAAHAGLVGPAASRSLLPWLETTLPLCAEAMPLLAPDHEAIRVRATEISAERRRRGLVLLGGALALVVTVSLVVWAATRSTNPAVADPDPAAAPSPSSPIRPEQGSPLLDGISVGEQAALPWWHRGSVVLPPDREVTADLPPRTRVTGIAPFRSGVLLLEDAGINDAVYLDHVGADGALLWRRLAAPRLVSTDGGRQVVYALYDQASGAYVLTLADATDEGAPERTWVLDHAVSPVGAVGDQVVFNDDTTFSAMVTTDGRPRRIRSLVAATSTCAAEGTAVGLSREGRAALVDVATDRVRWVTHTDWVPTALSPDCRRVIAVRRDGSGWGLLDAADGRQEVPLDVIWHAPTVAAAFEDDDHLLIGVRAGRSQALLRFDLVDLRLQRVGDVLPDSPHLVLPDQ